MPTWAGLDACLARLPGLSASLGTGASSADDLCPAAAHALAQYQACGALSSLTWGSYTYTTRMPGRPAADSQGPGTAKTKVKASSQALVGSQGAYSTLLTQSPTIPVFSRCWAWHLTSTPLELRLTLRYTVTNFKNVISDKCYFLYPQTKE